MRNNLFCKGLTLILVTATLATTASPAAAQTVSKEDINLIRKKSVLDRDLTTIDAFVAEQFRAMARSVKTTEMDNVRDTLMSTSLSTSAVRGARKIYSDRFANAVRNSYQELFAAASRIEDADLAEHLRLSCVMVMAATDNPILVDDLVKLVPNNSTELSYWAIKALARPNTAAFLSAESSSPELAAELVKQLTQRLALDTTATAIINIANANRSLPDVNERALLLQKCVQNRLTQYRSWTVSNESSDLRLIEIIIEVVDELEADSIEFENPELLKNQLIRDAAGLFTAVYHRYDRGMAYDDKGDEPLVLLSKKSQTELLTVLIAGEIALRRAADDNRASRFVRAIQSKNLQPAYDNLLGANGVVPRKFAIFTDQSPEDTLFAPLPDPPEELIQGARTLKELSDKLLKPER